jgi:5,5'-dehydrodivanillate O-demethylase
MLSDEQNRMLTEVGAAKPMGKLLRRYWLPFAGASEFEAKPIKAMRLLGEDLVAYRDFDGNYGLIDRHCPHRRADLLNGFVERKGLRCSYHGWLMDQDGGVLETPFDDTTKAKSRIKENVKVSAYPVRELGGLLFTYMGPLPAPELPMWEALTWTTGFREIVRSEIPCNWLQCQENANDPVHFEWAHDNWSRRLEGRHEYAAPHVKIAFEEVEYGHLYRRLVQGQDDTGELWANGRMVLWPVGFFLGEQFEWRVPIDDENTLSLSWFYSEPPKDVGPYRQTSVPIWDSPIKDEHGNWVTTHVINQDIVAWVGQGRIADRTKEHLSVSDRGIVMLRRRYFEEMKRVEAGEDPRGVIRDPQVAKLIKLPIVGRTRNSGELTLEEWKSHPFLKLRFAGHRHCAGQPARVREEYERAMGFDQMPHPAQA